ncbi:protein MIZU-KUSSEI 1-like [Curcuma longa]|uniref:protein MIZU-KUSSEI 1-like n=1 Tax=Curcuma longa TaxID=136217 RepID=UPI003D9ED367
MKSILARSPHESSSSSSSSSFSFSRRHSYWLIEKPEDEEILCFDRRDGPSIMRSRMEKQREFSFSFSRFRSAVFGRRSEPGLGRQVMGTLFGRRGGRMHFAVQGGPGARPALLVELGASTAALAREMESGLVRIALECERPAGAAAEEAKRLTEELQWRAYCNGKKCGEAVRRECGREEWRVLGAVERVTMGAGVLPAADGEVMYMRARFERVVVSKDYEAYFVINPDNHRGPELTVYLLRNLINTNKSA